MLDYLPHKEGIWDSKLAACLARKVAEVEEWDYQGGEICEDWSLSSTPDEGVNDWLAPEECRVRDVEVELPEGEGGRMGLTCVQQQRSAGASACVMRKMIYDLKLKQWIELKNPWVSWSIVGNQPLPPLKGNDQAWPMCILLRRERR